MTTDALLVRQVAMISGLAVLAIWMLRAGGGLVVTVAGGLVAAVALAGLVALVRVVVVSERERARR